MNKKELIDKAVEHLSGNFDNAKEYNISLGGERLFYNCRYDKFLRVSGHVDGITDSEVISRSEFTQRARELGWCNGYKYGVEYETNGKKPDLLDDVLVEVLTQNDGWIKCKVHQWFSFSDLIISKNTKFLIVDERYKPVEVELVQADWYCYDRQQAVALPPAGVECEVYREQKWERCFVLHHANNDFVDVAACKIPQHKGSQVGFLVWADKFRPLDWNRKADEEKRAFVEAALGALGVAECAASIKWIENLYEAGCRFTENKAAS